MGIKTSCIVTITHSNLVIPECTGYICRVGSCFSLSIGCIIYTHPYKLCFKFIKHAVDLRS